MATALQPILDKILQELIKSNAFKPGVLTKESMAEFKDAMERNIKELGVNPQDVMADKARLKACCISFHLNRKEFKDMFTLLYKPEALTPQNVNVKNLESQLLVIKTITRESLEKPENDLRELKSGRTPRPTPGVKPSDLASRQRERTNRVMHGEVAEEGGEITAVDGNMDPGLDELAGQASELWSSEGHGKRTHEDPDREPEAPSPFKGMNKPTPFSGN